MRLPRLSVIALLAALPLLASCDLLGIESGEAVAARNEAEGKAIGSACRHAMRAIEDCYTLNPKAVKASVYTGGSDGHRAGQKRKKAALLPQPDGLARYLADAQERPDGHGLHRCL